MIARAADDAARAVAAMPPYRSVSKRPFGKSIAAVQGATMQARSAPEAPAKPRRIIVRRDGKVAPFAESEAPLVEAVRVPQESTVPAAQHSIPAAQRPVPRAPQLTPRPSSRQPAGPVDEYVVDYEDEAPLRDLEEFD
jgi:hypothetical protein